MRGLRVSGDGVNRLYLFLFFTVGSLAAQLSLQSLAVFHQTAFRPVLLMGSLSAAVILFAVSAFGTVLIPLLSLGLGAICGIGALELVSDWAQQGTVGWKSGLALLLETSVFFCIAVRGMQLSSLLCACLERQRKSDGGSDVRMLLPMTAVAALSGAILYFL